MYAALTMVLKGLKVLRAFSIAAALVSLCLVGYTSYLYNQDNTRLFPILSTISSFCYCVFIAFMTDRLIRIVQIKIDALEIQLRIKERIQTLELQMGDAEIGEQPDLIELRSKLNQLKNGWC